jgi:hypothetical protein
MLHFGELDPHIPMSDVETIKSKQPSIDVYTYDAGHGFQCDERDSCARHLEDRMCSGANPWARAPHLTERLWTTILETCRSPRTERSC